MKFNHAATLKYFIVFQCVIFLLVAQVYLHPERLLVPVDVSNHWSLNRENFAARPWTFFTSAFMHINLIHLGLNMLCVYALGQIGTLNYIRKSMWTAYGVGLIFSSIFILAFPNAGDVPTVGASGAVFALLSFFALSGTTLELRKPLVKAIIFNMAFTLLIPGISWQAHTGGLIGGAIVAFVSNYIIWKKEIKSFDDFKTAGFYFSEKTKKEQIFTMLGSRHEWEKHSSEGVSLARKLNINEEFDSDDSLKYLHPFAPVGLENAVIDSTVNMSSFKPRAPLLENVWEKTLKGEQSKMYIAAAISGAGEVHWNLTGVITGYFGKEDDRYVVLDEKYAVQFQAIKALEEKIDSIYLKHFETT